MGGRESPTGHILGNAKAIYMGKLREILYQIKAQEV
jgi:hypothetical protein